jgi:transposase-like protein
MSMQRRKFTKEFKIQIIREIDNGTPVAQLSRQHQICDHAMPPDIS